MLTADRATEMARETAKNYRATRHHFDALWTLALVYDSGPQWGYLSSTTGNMEVKYLRKIIYPHRRDIRMKLNEVHKNDRKLISMTNPQRIASSVRSRVSATYGNSCDTLLEAFLRESGGLYYLRWANHVRIILGSSALMRTIRVVGKGQAVQPAQGRREELALRRFKLGWSVGYPWAFIRDPSAKTLRPEKNEEIIGYEEPWPAEKVERYFGVKIKTESKMGDLVHYQDDLIRASGASNNGGGIDSKQPAVYVSQWCYQDSTQDREWPRMMIAIRDPKAQKDKEYNPIEIGLSERGGKGKGLIPNPHDGLPWTFLHYDWDVVSAWARGAPMLQMDEQDLHNIAWTWLVRTMQLGAGKWKGVLQEVEGHSEMLNNDPGKPIWYRPWNANSRGPEFVPAPQIQPAAMEIASAMPDKMRQSVNMAEVQFGTAVKRGEANKAYETRIQQANTVIEDMHVEDETSLGTFLKGTTVDLINLSSVDDMAELVGDKLSSEQVYALKRVDPAKAIESVDVHPAMLRPRTPADVSESFTNYATVGILTPPDAIFEMWEQGRVCLDSQLRHSIEKQQIEIEIALRGEPMPPPERDDQHQHHMRVCKMLIDSKRWGDIPPEIQEQIRNHNLGHQIALIQVSQAMAMAQPQQGNSQGAPSPSNAAVEAVGGPAGSVGPAVNVA